MLNVRTILLGILCVLFGSFIVVSIISTAIGQTPPDATSTNPVPSQLKTAPSTTTQPQLDTLTIIQEIHASEKRVSGEIQNLKTDIEVLKTRVNTIQWILTIIGAPILIYLITLGIQKLPKRGNKTETIPETSQSLEESKKADKSSRDGQPLSEFL